MCVWGGAGVCVRMCVDHHREMETEKHLAKFELNFPFHRVLVLFKLSLCFKKCTHYVYIISDDANLSWKWITVFKLKITGHKTHTQPSTRLISPRDKKQTEAGWNGFFSVLLSVLFFQCS